MKYLVFERGQISGLEEGFYLCTQSANAIKKLLHNTSLEITHYTQNEPWIQ